jgi:hypothetical protein
MRGWRNWYTQQLEGLCQQWRGGSSPLPRTKKIRLRSRIFCLERETGFAPATFSLARRRSTTELLPQCAEGEDRTLDTAIFSRVLYH